MAVQKGRFGGLTQPGSRLDQLTGEHRGAEPTAGDHEIGQLQGGWQCLLSDDTQVVTVSKGAGAVGAGVDLQVGHASLTQRGDGGPSVGPGAHQQDPGPLQGRELACRQVQADGNDAAAIAAQPSGAGQAPGGGGGVLDGASQRPGERAVLMGQDHGAAQLAGDLALTDHHGLQACGGGKELGDGVHAVPRAQRESVQPGTLGQEGGDDGAQPVICLVAHGLGRRGRVQQDGQAVAGSQDDDTLDPRHSGLKVWTQVRHNATQSGDEVKPVGSMISRQKMKHSRVY